MERDDIIRMAREAGFICLFPDEAVNGIGTIYNYNSGDEEITEMMERFAALVAAYEREECAKAAIDYHEIGWDPSCAAAMANQWGRLDTTRECWEHNQLSLIEETA